MIKKNKKIFYALLSGILIQSSVEASSTSEFFNFKVGIPYVPNDINVTWNQGNLIETSNHCVLSFRNKKRVVGFYQTMTNNIGSYQGKYALQNENGDYILANVQYLNTDNGYYYDFYPSNEHYISKGNSECYDNNPNKFRINIDESQLINAASGNYSATFSVNTKSASGYGYPSVNDSFKVNVFIPYKIRVNQLDDISLGIYNGYETNDFEKTEEFCVFTRKGEPYNLTIFGDMSGIFNLKNENGDAIPYEIYYYNDYQTNEINYNIYETVYGLYGNSYENCEYGNKSYLKIVVKNKDLNPKLTAGEYKSTITLIVSPD